MEVGLNTETIAGGGLLGGAGIVFLRKFYLDWINSRPQTASASAMESQFKALREQIEALQSDNKVLRAEFNNMDAKLHRQQTKLTRTEMLLRQFVGLQQQHGIPIPEFMQKEVDDLLKIEPAPSPPPETF